MAEFRTDEVRRRYRRKLGLRERIGSGHYLYEIVSPAGTRIGRTALPRGRAPIGKPLRAEIAQQFRVPASDWDSLIDCRLSAQHGPPALVVNQIGDETAPQGPISASIS